MFAGHLPTVHFDHLVWLSMPVWEPKDLSDCPPDGFFRTLLHGKPIVGFHAPVDSGAVSFLARPVVHIKMWRRT